MARPKEYDLKYDPCWDNYPDDYNAYDIIIDWTCDEVKYDYYYDVEKFDTRHAGFLDENDNLPYRYYEDDCNAMLKIIHQILIRNFYSATCDIINAKLQDELKNQVSIFDRELCLQSYLELLTGDSYIGENRQGHFHNGKFPALTSEQKYLRRLAREAANNDNTKN